MFERFNVQFLGLICHPVITHPRRWMFPAIFAAKDCRRQMYLVPLIICLPPTVSQSFTPIASLRRVARRIYVFVVHFFLPSLDIFHLLHRGRTLSCWMEALCVNGLSTCFLWLSCVLILCMRTLVTLGFVCL